MPNDALNGGLAGSGFPARLRSGTMVRFWRRVRKSGECWVWQGPIHPLGYGVSCVAGIQGAHRIAWVWKHKMLPGGHLRNVCGNLACVNPAHWRDDGPKPVSRVKARGAEIERLFRAGVGIGEIADRVGCSRTTVWRWTHGISVEGPVEASEGADADGDGAVGSGSD